MYGGGCGLQGSALIALTGGGKWMESHKGEVFHPLPSVTLLPALCYIVLRPLLHCPLHCNGFTTGMPATKGNFLHFTIRVHHRFDGMCATSPVNSMHPLPPTPNPKPPSHKLASWRDNTLWQILTQPTSCDNTKTKSQPNQD